MEELQQHSMAYRPIQSVSPLSGMGWGALAGLAGTLAMDIALLASLPALGLPADTCYLTIGSTVGQFFALLGVSLTGEVALGVAAYHIIGPLLGAGYGLLVSQVKALKRLTLKKNVLQAVLYAEVLSQLILSLAPILLKMPAQETLLWYAGSFLVHMLWGIVMGIVTFFGWQGRSGEYKDEQAKTSGGKLWTARR